VVQHPDSTWTHEVLSYRLRVLYYSWLLITQPTTQFNLWKTKH
jgi:hypothetical protein